MIRTRFAPSPTGSLHIGGLRTALYAYFFARQNGGKMILRIEDTDKEREVEGAVGALIKVLQDMGIDYDEGLKIRAGHTGTVSVGDHGPYIQSERLPIYREHVDKLLKIGLAYPCFCTSERLTEMREVQKRSKQQPKYDRHCLDLSKEEVKKKLQVGEPHVVRMKIPNGATVVEDVVYGKMLFPNTDLDDQVLLKSDGYPTYHLAVVIDDHLMEVSHVLRGEDWLSSTPKHVILYEMFGWKSPVFAHLPNLLGENKKKLSKRQDDVAVEDFLNRGYLPEALNNFVATLGFNPKGDQEIYSMDELIRLFDLTKVNRGGAVVNYEKLDWMNAHYIRETDLDCLVRTLAVLIESEGKVVPLDTLGMDRFRRIVEVERGRMTTLKDILESLTMYDDAGAYAAELLVWKKADRKDARSQLESVSAFLESLPEEAFMSIDGLEAKLKAYIEENGLETGNVLWPMRVALSGQKNSPSPFELAWVFGKIETLARLKKAVEKLS